MSSSTLTAAEKEALLRAIMGKERPAVGTKCNCALHRLSPEERAALFDAAIDATVAEIRDGLLPEEETDAAP